jgi:DNA-binding NarL/FixJ family response regulator
MAPTPAGTAGLTLARSNLALEVVDRRVSPAPARGVQSERGQIKVLIADEQAMFRSGVVHLLEGDPGIAVVGEAADGEEAVRQARALKPDLVLIALDTPKVDGVEAARLIVSEDPNVKVLILGTPDADTHAVDALLSGASGYLLKNSRPEAIRFSIFTVLAGEWVMTKSLAKRFLEHIATNGKANGDLDNGLTAREVEVFKLLASGLANKQIAYRLNISEKTVGRHIGHVYAKLKLTDRAHAILYAVRKGLVQA